MTDELPSHPASPRQRRQHRSTLPTAFPRLAHAGWRPIVGDHYLNEQGVHWELTNDRLARKNPDGTPDYTDPNAFPIMWSESICTPLQA